MPKEIWRRAVLRVLLDLNVNESGRVAVFAVDGPRHPLVSGHLVRVDFEVRGTRLENLLLGVELSVGLAFEPCHVDEVARCRVLGGSQNLDLVGSRGAHHHRLAHDAPHLGRLQVAHQNGLQEF